MKVALFGGTFDPIHLGHLMCAESARDAFSLSKVVFLPTGIPPHKSLIHASAPARVRMLKEAIRGNASFDLSMWEIQQKRMVYTTETLDYFMAQYGKLSLSFIVGSDSLANIDSWKEGRQLLRKVRFLIAERPEMPWHKIPLSLRKKVRLIPHTPLSVASHEIRDRVKEKKSIRYLVPDSVRKYISQQHLYE